MVLSAMLPLRFKSFKYILKSLIPATRLLLYKIDIVLQTIKVARILIVKSVANLKFRYTITAAFEVTKITNYQNNTTIESKRGGEGT